MSFKLYNLRKFLLLGFLSLLGCQLTILESDHATVTPESSVSDASVVVTERPSPTPLPPPEILTPDPCQSLKPLASNEPENKLIQLAYLKDRDIWTWDSLSGEARPLTNLGDILEFKVSSDQKLVAFTRGYFTEHELWVMNLDGDNQRKVISSSDLLALREDEEHKFVTLAQWEWRPGSHVVAYVPRGLIPVASETFTAVLYEHLKFVDADTGIEQSPIPVPELAGNFAFSPDGEQVAIIVANGLRIIGDDEGAYKDYALRHDPWYVGMGAVSPQLSWSADSQNVYTVLSVEDADTSLDSPLTLWRIPGFNNLSGSATFLLEIIGFFPTVDLSPDQKFLAVNLHGSQTQAELQIYNIETNELVYANSDHEIVEFNNWHPDSRRFVYRVSDEPNQNNYFISDLYNCSIQPVGQNIVWLNDVQYLFVKLREADETTSGFALELWLGTVGGSDVLIGIVDGIFEAQSAVLTNTHD